MQKISDLFNNSFKYLIAALLIIVPLYPKFPFIEIPGIYVSIRAEDFLLAIIGIFVLIKILPRIKEFFKDKIILSMTIFLTVGLVSLIAGVFLTQTVSLSIGILHLLRRVEYFMPFFAVVSFLPHEKDKNLEFYVKILIIVVLAAFIYGIGERYFGFPVIITQDSESSKGLALRWSPGSQITSTFAGHYDLAAFMVLVLPILISLFFTIQGKLSKTTLFVSVLSGFWLLVNSTSRISFVSYLLATCISLLLLKKYKAMVVIVLLSIILSGFSAGLFARYKSLIDVYSSKIKAVKIMGDNPFRFTVLAQETTLTRRTDASPTPILIPVIEDRSTAIRLNVEWPRAIRAFVKDPLIGTGYSSIGLAADNDYLRLMAEVGFLGLLGFGLVFAQIFFTFVSVFPLTQNFSGLKLGFISGVIGGIFGTLLNASFIDVFEASKFAIIFWLLVGLAVFIVKDKINVNKN